MTTVEKVNGTSLTAEPRFDPVALAKAEAIRKQADAEADALRIEAEGKAKADEIKAREEAERQRIINERAAMKLEREKAAHALHITETNRKREGVERQQREARDAEEAERQSEAEQQEAQQKTATVWFGCALGFAIVCGIVALPVQMSAFYNRDALWLLAAPLFLEGGAWVVLQGARAAVEDRRPHWHYRLIAWALAFIAAGVNLKHGLDKFDVATAIGTAFASVAGPGVWDLHEHGRIRKRDGVPTRAERKAQEKAAERVVAEKAAAAKKAEEEKKAREKAATEAAEKLAKDRAEHFPKVWEHALKLAAALGEATVTEAVWRRAHKDIEGADPGDTVDIIRTRNVNARRVAAALSEAPGNTPRKVTSTQRAIQIKAPAKRSSYRPVPPRRAPGDTPRYHRAARIAVGETTRKSKAAKTTAAEQ